jgi:hypothetical protein
MQREEEVAAFQQKESLLTFGWVTSSSATPFQTQAPDIPTRVHADPHPPDSEHLSLLTRSAHSRVVPAPAPRSDRGRLRPSRRSECLWRLSHDRSTRTRDRARMSRRGRFPSAVRAERKKKKLKSRACSFCEPVLTRAHMSTAHSYLCTQMWIKKEGTASFARSLSSV